MMVNQKGEQIVEELLFSPPELEEGELAEAVFALIRHLDLDLYRTNATKHGNTQLELRPK